jgi:hypothetical protein
MNRTASPGRSARATAAGGEGPRHRQVTIALSPAQVNRVVSDLHGTGGPTPSPPDLDALRSVVGSHTSAPQPFEGGRLSKALLCGLLVLSCLPSDGSYVGVKEVGAWAGLAPSSAHRYLRTLVAAGVVERNPASRKYKLVESR